MKWITHFYKHYCISIRYPCPLARKQVVNFTRNKRSFPKLSSTHRFDQTQCSPAVPQYYFYLTLRCHVLQQTTPPYLLASRISIFEVSKVHFFLFFLATLQPSTFSDSPLRVVQASTFSMFILSCCSHICFCSYFHCMFSLLIQEGDSFEPALIGVNSVSNIVVR